MQSHCFTDTLDSDDNSGWFISLAAWTVNFLFFAFIFVRTLIHGEPYIERQSKAAVLYWRQRKQADCDMDKVMKTYSTMYPVLTCILIV